MMFSGIEHMGEVPFDTIFIHGIVRDSQGRKMSKSLGNGIDPLEVIATYGTDVHYFPSFDEIENFLLTNCKKNDLLITMGAGDVVNIGESLLK